MKAMLRAFPGRSVWHPADREFVLVSPWRHREETAILAEISGVRHVQAMIESVFDRCRQEGAKVVLTAEMHERQRPQFWSSVGMHLFETVIALALSPLRVRGRRPNRLAFQRLASEDAEAVALLTTIDNDAFPWLWWNSRTEFSAYLALDDVEVYLATLSGDAVGYVGLTRYRGWGHLDRIAIRPGYQGAGLGREAVDFAITRCQELGFHSLSLSTQEENWQSRAVYGGAGFKRMRDNDYRLYGHWLVDEQSLPGPGNGVRLVNAGSN